MRLEFTDEAGRPTYVNPAHVVRVRKEPMLTAKGQWRVNVVDTHGWTWWYDDLTEEQADARILGITDHWR